jgi:hypothetical protein
MRKLFILFICTFAILIGALLSTSANDSKTEESHQLPSSLDALFPPKAQGPIYLDRMFGLATPFTGIVVDLLEGDIKNVQDNFEKFKIQYEEVSNLVPEWKHDFPQDPVTNLGAALKSGDRGKIMEAYGKVGKVCHECHVEYMTKTYYKYHWKDVETIKVKDPLSKEEVKYSTFMQYIGTNFTGIGVDLQQGQKENALKQFQGFKARFGTMKEICQECHDDKEKKTERKYYVDESVMALIDKLGQALNAPTIDPKALGNLMKGIGGESCFKCHLVHVPAALAKH